MCRECKFNHLETQKLPNVMHSEGARTAAVAGIIRSARSAKDAIPVKIGKEIEIYARCAEGRPDRIASHEFKRNPGTSTPKRKTQEIRSGLKMELASAGELDSLDLQAESYCSEAPHAIRKFRGLEQDSEAEEIRLAPARTQTQGVESGSPRNGEECRRRGLVAEPAGDTSEPPANTECTYAVRTGKPITLKHRSLKTEKKLRRPEEPKCIVREVAELKEGVARRAGSSAPTGCKF
ncbi:hypothetical protein DFH09DRAFT_1082738 [Mycena vulgaris]|nr:hypothetical protein DFH09DRAFT_1082738 [Mycena vulgaris]